MFLIFKLQITPREAFVDCFNNLFRIPRDTSEVYYEAITNYKPTVPHDIFIR
jgi:hypothetical protein